jgi:hypothetical protein
VTVPPYVLTYEAPAECPAQEAFQADVAKRFHDESHVANIRLDVSIEELDARYSGAIAAFDETAKESARRRIEGKSCKEVAHALAFLAGLILELNGRIDPDEELPAPPPPPPEVPLPMAPPVRVATPGPPVHVSAFLLGDARGGFGPSVYPSGDAGLDIGIGSGTFSPSVRFVGFGGRGSLGSQAGNASLWFGGGRLELCPFLIGATNLVARICAGGELGAVHVEGQVPFEPRGTTVLWASAEATLRIQWFATRSFYVELGGGPVLPLDRTRYYFEPNSTVYQSPFVAARMALGLGWQF